MYLLTYTKTKTMKKQLTIGDTVMWRGGFGMNAPKKAKVIGIEITNGVKYGDDAFSVDWSKVNSRNVVVDLDIGCWAYGSQLKQIE